MEPSEIDMLPTVLELDWQQFYARQGMSRAMLTGLHREQFHVAWDMIRDELWATFTAAVMAEDAGPTESDWVKWLSPIRPWWIPKWLWRRIPTKIVDYKLTVLPRYIYPHATIKVPEIGPPVRIAVINHRPYNPLHDWRQEQNDD